MPKIEVDPQSEVIGWPLPSTLAEALGYRVAHETWPEWIDRWAEEIEHKDSLSPPRRRRAVGGRRAEPRRGRRRAGRDRHRRLWAGAAARLRRCSWREARRRRGRGGRDRSHRRLASLVGVPVSDALARCAETGVATVVCTSIDRDGTRAGPISSFWRPSGRASPASSSRRAVSGTSTISTPSATSGSTAQWSAERGSTDRSDGLNARRVFQGLPRPTQDGIEEFRAGVARNAATSCRVLPSR